MPLNLILPRSARPTHRCRICQKPFWEDQDRERVKHTVECAAEHREELEELRKVKRPDGFFTDADPELAEYQRRTGKWD